MKTKFIFECGCNHQGNIKIAKQMIDEAVKLGAWAVKFQKRDIESMHKGLRDLLRNDKNSFGATYGEHREALEFSINQIKELQEYAKYKYINLGISIFDLVSFKQMVKLIPDFIKLPSQLYSNFEINNCIQNMNWDISIFVSTGMHTLQEIINCQFFDKTTVTFYCRSMYPFNLLEGNLVDMRLLARKLKNSKLGYSSHEKKGQLIPAAILIGAEYIERHFTLDKSWKGSDHGTVASDPCEMENIIESIEHTELILGEENKLLSEKEEKVKKIFKGFY